MIDFRIFDKRQSREPSSEELLCDLRASLGSTCSLLAKIENTKLSAKQRNHILASLGSISGASERAIETATPEPHEIRTSQDNPKAEQASIISADFIESPDLPNNIQSHDYLITTDGTLQVDGEIPAPLTSNEITLFNELALDRFTPLTTNNMLDTAGFEDSEQIHSTFKSLASKLNTKDFSVITTQEQNGKKYLFIDPRADFIDKRKTKSLSDNPTKALKQTTSHAANCLESIQAHFEHERSQDTADILAQAAILAHTVTEQLTEDFKRSHPTTFEQIFKSSHRETSKPRHEHIREAIHIPVQEEYIDTNSNVALIEVASNTSVLDAQGQEVELSADELAVLNILIQKRGRILRLEDFAKAGFTKDMLEIKSFEAKQRFFTAAKSLFKIINRKGRKTVAGKIAKQESCYGMNPVVAFTDLRGKK